MPPANPALQRELSPESELHPQRYEVTLVTPTGPRRLTETPSIHVVPAPRIPRKEPAFQPRIPVITGEARFHGWMPVDGTISGQLGVGGNGITTRQRPKNASAESEPELDGELTFKDMLRINGHVRGKMSSSNGTLIIDNSARVDGEIQVATCVIGGVVNGDVSAYDRVELGPGAIIHGNIATKAITIKPGAVFHGDCRMIREETVI